MSALYIGLVLLVLAALAGMPAMKRAGDRNWRVYQFQQRMEALRLAMRQVSVAVEGMAPAFRRATRAMQQFGEAMRGSR